MSDLSIFDLSSSIILAASHTAPVAGTADPLMTDDLTL
jgi:hypothetical protein